jgi:hypothetical protein
LFGLRFAFGLGLGQTDQGAGELAKIGRIAADAAHRESTLLST